MDVLTTKEAIPVDVKIVHSKSETATASVRQTVLNNMYRITHPVINRDGSQAQSNVQLAVELESVMVVRMRSVVVVNLVMVVHDVVLTVNSVSVVAVKLR